MLTGLLHFVLIVVFGLVRLASTALKVVPRNRDCVVFIGHQGHFNGNARALYEEAHRQENDEKFDRYRCCFLVTSLPKDDSYSEVDGELININNRSGWLRACLTLWHAKVIVITTPGFYWKSRHFFGAGAVVILLSNGIPLKAPGKLSRHFTTIKWLKYRFYWRDVDEIWVSSKFEQYMVSASIDFPIDKVILTGAARQGAFNPFSFAQKRPAATDELGKLVGKELAGKKLVLIALTQRAYREEANWTTFDSIRSLRGYSDLSLAQLLDHSNCHLFCRDHFLANGGGDEFLGNKNITQIGSDVLPEISDFMPAFDLIVTDYSGLYLDLLRCPVDIALLRFNDDDFIEKRGIALSDKFLTSGLEIHDFVEFSQVIRRQDIDVDQMKIRSTMHSLFFEVPAEECLNSNYIRLSNLLDIRL